MGCTGKCTPAMRPASRAHKPAALTTISALMTPFGVVTSQLPSARWRVAITGVCVKYCAPCTRADFAYAYTTPEGSTSPSMGSHSAAM